MNYVDKFLGLRCAPDILAVHPLTNGAKEITESMAIIEVMRPVTLAQPMAYTLLDLCAGNALTSLIAVHLLPVKRAIAIDRSRRSGQWGQVERFEYVEGDIGLARRLDIEGPLILVAVHPCQMATDIVGMFLDFAAARPEPVHLYLMPCCVGKREPLPPLLEARLSEYERWCTALWLMLRRDGIDANVYQDNHVMSPANIIIAAHANGETSGYGP